MYFGRWARAWHFASLTDSDLGRSVGDTTLRLVLRKERNARIMKYSALCAGSSVFKDSERAAFSKIRNVGFASESFGFRGSGRLPFECPNNPCLPGFSRATTSQSPPPLNSLGGPRVRSEERVRGSDGTGVAKFGYEVCKSGPVPTIGPSSENLFEPPLVVSVGQSSVCSE